MLSKNKIKFINSLKIKKYRDEYQLFIAEGDRCVIDLLLAGLQPEIILANSLFLNSLNIKLNCEIIETDLDSIKKLSLLSTPQNVIGIFKIPNYSINFDILKTELSIFADDIQNPGNIGTIIRTADWFGVKNIFCSKNSVDIYNPKVIQATMGGIGRVKIHYLEQETFFENKTISQIPVYGALLSGSSIYEQKLENNAIIVIGNEGNGICLKTEKYITKKIKIPNYPIDSNTTESLNVAVATAIILSEFRRQK